MTGPQGAARDYLWNAVTGVSHYGYAIRHSSVVRSLRVSVTQVVFYVYMYVMRPLRSREQQRLVYMCMYISLQVVSRLSLPATGCHVVGELSICAQCAWG